MPEEWLLFNDISHIANRNMAIDETLLNSCSKPILRFYSWSEPAVSIGYFQKHEIALSNEYTFVRRPSGGGFVDHRNDLTFSLILPKEHQLLKDRCKSYQSIHLILKESLLALGIESELHDQPLANLDNKTLKCFISAAKYDLLLGDKKIAGGAQKRTKTAFLHQGSILLDHIDIEKDTLISVIIQTICSELDVIFEPFYMSNIIDKRVADLVDMKYSTNAWQYKF